MCHVVRIPYMLHHICQNSLPRHFPRYSSIEMSNDLNTMRRHRNFFGFMIKRDFFGLVNEFVLKRNCFISPTTCGLPSKPRSSAFDEWLKLCFVGGIWDEETFFTQYGTYQLEWRLSSEVISTISAVILLRKFEPWRDKINKFTLRLREGDLLKVAQPINKILHNRNPHRYVWAPS